MKVVLFTAIGIQAVRKFWILANDFKFDIMSLDGLALEGWEIPTEIFKLNINS